MATLAKIGLATVGVAVALVTAGGVYAFTHPGTYQALRETVGQELCIARDGKWGSTIATCVTRACYQDGNCGHWANPIHRCDRLRVGDSIAEVYFQLGDPDAIEGGTYTWHAYKISDERIVARIEREKLTYIACMSAR